MRHSLRFRMFLRFVIPTLLILPCTLLVLGTPAIAQQKPLTLIWGGDVRATERRDTMTVRYVDSLTPGKANNITWQKMLETVGALENFPIPFLETNESRAYLKSLGAKGDSWGLGGAETPALDYVKPTMFREPGEVLQMLAPTLKAADLAACNVETPVSDTARMERQDRAPTKLAPILKSAGISLVTVANNHAFDAGLAGFQDTLRAFTGVGLPYVGGGQNLTEARQPVVLERNGIKIGFLGYAQFVNIGESGFASDGGPETAAGRPAHPPRAGVVPMDPFVIKEDIRRLRSRVDYVAVTIHWGNNGSSGPPERRGIIIPEWRQFAHDIIDNGADLILGHHAPAPKGIEVYRGKVIVYSAGFFARTDLDSISTEADGYLVRFTLGPKSAERVEVLPVAAGTLQGKVLLQGPPAQKLLETVRGRSAALDTKMAIEGDKGVITVSSSTPSSRK